MFKKIFAILSVLVLTLAFASPVLAVSMPTSVYYPDISGPTISAVDMYTNYLQTGDTLAVINYNIGYTAANLPTATIDTTYIGTLNSGSTQLGNVAPYPYYNEGYKNGVFAIYWPTGSSNQPSWGSSYSAVLQGAPIGINWLSTTASTAVSAAEAYNATGPAWTDETTAANNVTANDMHLSYATANSAYYFGSSNPFGALSVTIGTPGVGTYTITWQYYNSQSVWAALSSVTDGTLGFTAAAGNYNVTFTLPTNWQTVTENAIGPYYYVRAIVSSYTSMTTAPLGTRSWVNSGSTAPSVANTSLNWHSTSSVTATSLLLGANVISWATTFANTWSIALTQTSTGVGTQLSTYGQQYFTNAIPGLQAACPQIFTASSSFPQIVYSTAAPSMPGVTVPQSNWPFDTTGIAHWFIPGGSDNALRMIGFLVLMGFVAWIATAKSGRWDMGMMIIAGSIPMACAMGGLPMLTVFIMGVLCALALAFVLILQRGAA